MVEADGTLVPAAYGLSRTLALGNIREVRLKDAWRQWMAEGYPRFQQLTRRVFREVEAATETVAFDWYSRLADASRELAPAS